MKITQFEKLKKDIRNLENEQIKIQTNMENIENEWEKDFKTRDLKEVEKIYSEKLKEVEKLEERGNKIADQLKELLKPVMDEDDIEDYFEE